MKHFTRCMLLLFCTFIFLLITTQINEAARDRVADTQGGGSVEDQPPTLTQMLLMILFMERLCGLMTLSHRRFEILPASILLKIKSTALHRLKISNL